MAKGYYLTEEDLKVLRDVIARERSRQGRTTGRQGVDWDEHQAPEVYVARTPYAGISGLTTVGTGTHLDTGTGTGTGVTGDDVAGSASCAIYQVVDGEFLSIGTSLLVHNYSTEAVEGDKWVLVLRDKFGTWFVNDMEPAGINIARTPSAGIAALGEGADTGTGSGTHETGDDVPGSASCRIYRLLGSKLVYTGIHRTVYNLAPVSLPPGNWIVVVRDQYGTWVTPNTGLDFTVCS